MAEPRSTLIDPPIEDLLNKVDSKFTLVTLASKRARQINAYFNQLGEGLGAVVPPQVTSLARKPLSIAMEEIAASKVLAGEPGADEVPEIGTEEAEELAMLAALASEVEAIEELEILAETLVVVEDLVEKAEADEVGVDETGNTSA
jgi:DNA-directed RNA polymerase subunit omega